MSALSQQRPSSAPTTPPGIRTNVALKELNWFKTGGPARYFTEPTTAAELATAIAFAREQQLEIFVLGAGANILISDAGFNGLVIRPRLQAITILDDQNQLYPP